jgi:hypothetical protein
MFFWVTMIWLQRIFVMKSLVGRVCLVAYCYHSEWIKLMFGWVCDMMLCVVASGAHTRALQREKHYSYHRHISWLPSSCHSAAPRPRQRPCSDSASQTLPSSITVRSLSALRRLSSCFIILIAHSSPRSYSPSSVSHQPLCHLPNRILILVSRASL